MFQRKTGDKSYQIGVIRYKSPYSYKYMPEILDNYPPDESRVKVKAKLKRNEQFWFLYLTAEPEDVESVEQEKN